MRRVSIQWPRRGSGKKKRMKKTMLKKKTRKREETEDEPNCRANGEFSLVPPARTLRPYSVCPCEGPARPFKVKTLLNARRFKSYPRCEGMQKGKGDVESSDHVPRRMQMRDWRVSRRRLPLREIRGVGGGPISKIFDLSRTPARITRSLFTALRFLVRHKPSQSIRLIF